MSGAPREGLEAAVVAFVKAEVPWPRPRVIGPETELERDLRMLWEDVETLMERFFARFRVDPAGFDLVRHVTVPRPWFSFGERRGRVEPLTVGMLVEAAGRGRWG